MNFNEALQNLNWLAILTAALATFMIGGIWYGIFEKAWLSANNFTKESLKERNMPKVFGLSFVFAFIMAFNLALFIGKGDAIFGMIAGFMTGFGWVMFAIAIIALFEKKSLSYVLINGGYMILSFTAMGAILGVWK